MSKIKFKKTKMEGAKSLIYMDRFIISDFKVQTNIMNVDEVKQNGKRV